MVGKSTEKDWRRMNKKEKVHKLLIVVGIVAVVATILAGLFAPFRDKTWMAEIKYKEGWIGSVTVHESGDQLAVTFVPDPKDGEKITMLIDVGKTGHVKIVGTGTESWTAQNMSRETYKLYDEKYQWLLAEVRQPQFRQKMPSEARRARCRGLGSPTYWPRRFRALRGISGTLN